MLILQDEVTALPLINNFAWSLLSRSLVTFLASTIIFKMILTLIEDVEEKSDILRAYRQENPSFRLTCLFYSLISCL
jgi:hypothetical protein